jgi:cytoskeletal protein CcmA (bactofilin family)
MFGKDSKTTETTSAPSAAPKGAAPAKAGSNAPSIISADLKIIGDLKCSGDIQIDGTIEGNIDSRLLIVGPGARIEGSIAAETVRVSGAVHGQIKAKTVAMDKTAKVVGDVIHENLTMEAGAFLEGGVRRIEKVDASASISPLRPSGASNGQDSANQGDAQRSSIL